MKTKKIIKAIGVLSELKRQRLCPANLSEQADKVLEILIEKLNERVK